MTYKETATFCFMASSIILIGMALIYMGINITSGGLGDVTIGHAIVPIVFGLGSITNALLSLVP